MKELLILVALSYSAAAIAPAADILWYFIQYGHINSEIIHSLTENASREYE